MEVVPDAGVCSCPGAAAGGAVGGQTPGTPWAGGYSCSSAGAGRRGAAGGSGSSPMSELQLKASLGMGNLARKPVESLAREKHVDATPCASGGVSSPEANAELLLLAHLQDGHSFSPRRAHGPSRCGGCGRGRGRPRLWLRSHWGTASMGKAGGRLFHCWFFLFIIT